jgi:LytR cell envelope-related transcriptional attenuator
MDHPNITIQDPWRATALVASGIAALELLLILVLAAVLFVGPLAGDDGKPATAEAAPAAKPAADAPAKDAAKGQPAPAPAKAEPALERGETSVIVLNGNGTSGLAGEKADLVRTKGYLIAGTSNAPRTDFARSVVMFRPGYEAEARRLAKDFRVPRVAPLDGVTKRDLQGAHVALIVGDDA